MWIILLVIIAVLIYFLTPLKELTHNPNSNAEPKTSMESRGRLHDGAPRRNSQYAGLWNIFSISRKKDSSIWDKWVDAAMTEKNCPASSVIRDWYPNSYKGKLIDTHVHVASIPDDPNEHFDDEVKHPTMGVNITMGDLVCMMDVEDTAAAFAFFPVWEPITNPSIEIVKRTIKKYPNRFLPFIMPPDNDNNRGGFPTVDATALEKMLAEEPELFQGFGEIGLYERKGGADALPPDSERLRVIYPVVRKNNLVVYFHPGEGQKDSFKKILKENPDITFIWHGDQFVTYRENGRQDLSVVEEILSAHPNVYYGVDELYGDVFLLRPEVSKQKFVAHFKDYEPLLKKDLKTWKGFIERHPDQVIWGTDRGWSSAWSVDPEVALTLNRYSRAFIGRLNSAVQERFAHKNAEKIWTDTQGLIR